MGIILFSCDNKDDEEGIAQKNHFKIGEIEYELSKGTCENYGQMEDLEWRYVGYNLDLILFSSGFAIKKDSDGEMTFSGSGHMIYFEMFSSKATEFDSRDYSFSTSEPHPIGTFDYGDFSLSYTEYNDENWVEIKSGKVSISKTGAEYSISINCISENGETVTGFFKGPLQYFDYTFETKSANLKLLKKSKRYR